jgi:hypothetical protein
MKCQPAVSRRLSRRLCFLGVLLATPALAEDTRQLAVLPPPALETLRLEMLDNLLVLNQILELVGADKLKEAGELAEQRLGLSSQGRHRDKPFIARPGPHMPPAMHELAMGGHSAASEFAAVAKSGDRARTLASISSLTSTCMACHFAWRAR